VLAFTSSAAGEPFIGSRRALHVATGKDCSNGVCTWASLVQKDQHGRTLYVEHPQVVMHPSDSVSLLVRWLGTSGELMPGDPFGVTGYGDTALLQATLPDLELGNGAFVNPLTMDGNVNWLISGVYDPSVDNLLAISAQGQVGNAQAEPGITATPLVGVDQQNLGSSRPITLFSVPATPDLAVALVRSIDGTVVAGDEEVALNVTLNNLGTPLAADQLIDVEAYWDGPVGVGQMVGQALGITLSNPLATEVPLMIDIPTGVVNDAVHHLHVVVNPHAEIQESDAENNTQVLVFNELPVPENIVSALDRAGTTPLLNWDPLTDPRVTSYRAFRRESGSLDEIQVGVTPVAGFADLLAFPEQTYDYCFAALSASLSQSDCSEWVTVNITPIRTEVIFESGFE
jgi:hypothetical protein